MDFHLDEDQLALQDNVHHFCSERWPLDKIAERPPGALDRARWSELFEIGAVSLMAPEAHDGLGLGIVEGAVVFEQLGQHLVPGPCLWTALACFVMPEAARGECLVGGSEDRGASPHFVEHASELDALLVLKEDALVRIARSALPAPEPAEALDPHSGVGVYRTLPVGETIADAETARRLRRVGTALTAALQLGVAQAALDVSVAYSLDREQFGVPIGSFQALKHIMADMYVRVGLARSATYAAAAVLDDPAVGDAERSLHAAKLLAGEAAVANARASVQVLGGMGFTWNMPPNFLLKRALVLDECFGTPTAHALAIAAALEEESVQAEGAA